MILKNTFFKILLLVFALAIPIGFQNCSGPLNGGDTKVALSSMMGICDGDHVQGSRWWELDLESERVTCLAGNTIQLNYYVEKTCDNGITKLTGQRIASGTNPSCQEICQSNTSKWTMIESQVQKTVTCPDGSQGVNTYDRKVEYSCVNSVATPTGVVTEGDLLGSSCPIQDASSCKDANGVLQQEGSVWQERTTDFKYTQPCPGSKISSEVVCQRFVEYECINGKKQMSSRDVVTLNCSATPACANPVGTCAMPNGGLALSKSTWSSRITPDFVDKGVCQYGGDLMITSQRLQTYKCSSGAIVAQQVVRGSTISQTGICGPKACAAPNGIGQQSWVTTGATPQWGLCLAVSCNAGYELAQGVCLAPCPAGLVRNSALTCQAPTCAPGDMQACDLSEGKVGTQSCNADRISWGTCKEQTTCTPGSKKFAYSGGEKTFTVPSGCLSVRVKAWGAGGAGGRDSTANGGGGGFTNALLKVSGKLIVRVGGAGKMTSTGLSASAGWNGGGLGGAPTSIPEGSLGGGSGGGASSIRQGSVDLLFAGGGGGGSGEANAGGAGGRSPSPGGGLNSGYAATTTAGGAGGNCYTGCHCTAAATSGTAGTGGNGSKGDAAGGGGGGGYFGGGGGAGAGCYSTGAGGGGLSWTNPTYTNAVSYSDGSGRTPGGESDPQYEDSAGAGGVPTKSGKNGLIIISWPN